MRELINFLEGANRNLWINSGHVRVYVRKGFRYYQGRKFKCLEVASVEVQEKHQRQGHMGTWMTQAVSIACQEGYEALFVENALNPVMEQYCIKRGFQLHSGGLTPCYIKVLA